MRLVTCLMVLIMGLAVGNGLGNELKEYSNVTWIADASNDGDSFLVNMDGNRVRLRLYFVDTPECHVSWDSDARRVREQQRYFGLPEASLVVEYGHEAAAFTSNLLVRPFRVYTAFASALGRSPNGRVYAFVKTAEGKSLARLLVENGYARSYGVGRQTPEGVHRDEMKARLADLEASAMLKNRGIWERSDANLIEGLRAEQRAEDQSLAGIRSGIQDSEELQNALNVNTATPEELQRIKGIGPAIADRIVRHRPYQTFEDLTNVAGIAEGRLRQWKPFLTVE